MVFKCCILLIACLITRVIATTEQQQQIEITQHSSSSLIASDIDENFTFNEENCVHFSSVHIQIASNEIIRQNIQIFIFGIVLIIGTMGNLLVIYVIVINKKLKTVTNMYLLNLAVADLIYLQGIPFYLITLLKQQWIFKIILCKLYWIFTGINQFTGIFILTVLAFDRYLAVCHPVLAINWRKLASSRIISTIVWLISIIAMIPVILYSDVDSVVLPYSHLMDESRQATQTNLTTNLLYLNETTPECIIKPTCTIKWPEKSIIKTELAFIGYGLIISFFFPVTLISVFYFNVVSRLRRGSKLHNYSSERQRARRKVTILVLTVISVYFLTYAPFWIFQVVLTAYYLNSKEEIPEYIHKLTTHLSSFFQFLLYLNSALNPYLYAFLSEIFRNSFRMAITNPFVCINRTNNNNFVNNGVKLTTGINRLKSISFNDTRVNSINVASTMTPGQSLRLKSFNCEAKNLLVDKSVENSFYLSRVCRNDANSKYEVEPDCVSNVNVINTHNTSLKPKVRYDTYLNIITEHDGVSQVNI